MPRQPKHPPQVRQAAEQLLEQGKTQRQVGAELNVPPATVARWDTARKRRRPAPAAAPPPAPAPAAPPAAPQLEAAPATWRFEQDTPAVDPTQALPPPAAPPEQPGDDGQANDEPSDGISDEVRKQFGEFGPDQAKALIRSVAQQLDKRFVRSGCDPLAENELVTLETTCAPVVIKWLSGPLTPEVLALTGVCIVFGPRLLEVVQRGRAERKLEQAKPTAPDPATPAPVVQAPEQAAPAGKVDVRELEKRLGGMG